MLAGYLAFVAGFVNAAGLLLLGVFTSRVTGSVGRLSIGLSRSDAAGAAAVELVTLFRRPSLGGAERSDSTSGSLRGDIVRGWRRG